MPPIHAYNRPLRLRKAYVNMAVLIILAVVITTAKIT
jgi:hypothetical protein